MTPNDDTLVGEGGPEPTTRRVPRSRPRTGRSRSTAKRTRSLLSVMLRRPALQARTVMICQSCELTGGPFAAGEAAHLLAVHEQMHHGAVSLHRPPLPPPI
jgi:hypothetical protein